MTLEWATNREKEVTAMKRPDLLVLIAVWEFLSALWILIGIAAVSSVFFFVSPGMWWGWMDWELPRVGPIVIISLSVIVLVMVAYFIIALMGGIGLLQGKEWGRILSIVQAALSLFWVPVGTVIGILVLVYLTKSEVSEYFSTSS